MLAISCVTGPVFAFLEPFIAQMDHLPKPEFLTNYVMFKSNLINAFDDSDPVITEETQLRHLHQKNLPVSIYAKGFRMYAQQVEWNDATLMSQFKIHLPQPICNELARRPNSTTLEESLISEAIDTDNKLVKGPRERRSFNGNSNNSSTSSSAMDIDPKPNQSSRMSMMKDVEYNQPLNQAMKRAMKQVMWWSHHLKKLNATSSLQTKNQMKKFWIVSSQDSVKPALQRCIDITGL